MLLCLQICYGIIYGMGAKSLGEQMGVDENDAACYIESFKARYKGIHWGFPTTRLNISNITNISRVFPVVATVSLTPTQTAAHTHNVAVPM